MITRRALVGIGASAGGLLLAGCNKIAATPTARALFDGTEALTRDFSRLTASRGSLAREFADSDISSPFRSNGTSRPGNARYAALAANNFRDYRLVIDGLIRQPLSLSMDQIHRMPREPRRRGTTASRAGARSANGPARRWADCCSRLVCCRARATSSSTAPMTMARANITRALT